LQDIAGHLQGGIPNRDIDALERYWDVFPTLKSALFRPLRPGYSQLSILPSQFKTTIYEHPEFTAFISGMNAHFTAWRDKWSSGNAEPQLGNLKSLQPGFHPKELILRLAEDLLTHYTGKPLISHYAVYQHLMDYWVETMQDDCYLITADGWKAETTRIIETDKKGREKDKGWTCDLVPKALIVARCFAKEQTALDELTTELESITARLAELEEEHGGEEGAFSELDKVNKANVTSRLKEISPGSPGNAKPQLGRKGKNAQPGLGAPRDNESNDEEAFVLRQWLALAEEEADLKKRLKGAEAKLDARAYVHYSKLTEGEIKTLVVDDKWLSALDTGIHGETDRISQALTQRVKELAERYETPMPVLTNRVVELEAKVNGHLERMGFKP